jgi:methylglutamate dehydrogenase subunit D
VSAPEAGLRLAPSPAQLLELCAFRGRADALAARARARGLNLPEFGRSEYSRGRLALSVRPERWLIVSPPGAAEDLRELGSDAAALVSQSSALVLLSLEGAAVRKVLARGLRLDLDPDGFPPGYAAATIMAQVPVTLVRAPLGFIVLTPASTARHLREWLLHAGHAFGAESSSALPYSTLFGALSS